jgi:hypothetical protein
MEGVKENEMSNFESNRSVGRALALNFFEDEVTKREMWFDSDDLSGDDPLVLPDDGRIKITVEFVEKGMTVNRDGPIRE